MLGDSAKTSIDNAALSRPSLTNPPLPVFKHPVDADAPFHIPKLDPKQPLNSIAVDKDNFACLSIG